MVKRQSELQKKAISFEKKGVSMYLHAADQTNNPLARRLFYSLAIEEIEHITWIEDQLPQVSPESSEGVIEEKVKAVFASLREKEIRKDSDNVAALEKAMEMEKQGRDLYQSLRDEATTEDEKDFFRRLVVEEEKHLTSLENVYHYLTDSSDWFHSTESQTWNWMNL